MCGRSGCSTRRGGWVGTVRRNVSCNFSGRKVCFFLSKFSHRFTSPTLAGCVCMGVHLNSSLHSSSTHYGRGARYWAGVHTLLSSHIFSHRFNLVALCTHATATAAATAHLQDTLHMHTRVAPSYIALRTLPPDCSGGFVNETVELAAPNPTRFCIAEMQQKVSHSGPWQRKRWW